jgi:hypothetical protein
VFARPARFDCVICKKEVFDSAGVFAKIWWKIFFFGKSIAAKGIKRKVEDGVAK